MFPKRPSDAVTPVWPNTTTQVDRVVDCENLFGEMEPAIRIERTTCWLRIRCAEDFVFSSDTNSQWLTTEQLLEMAQVQTGISAWSERAAQRFHVNSLSKYRENNSLIPLAHGQPKD
jgi:hypothetical protein